MADQKVIMIVVVIIIFLIGGLGVWYMTKDDTSDPPTSDTNPQDDTSSTSNTNPQTSTSSTSNTNPQASTSSTSDDNKEISGCPNMKVLKGSKCISIVPTCTDPNGSCMVLRSDQNNGRVDAPYTFDHPSGVTLALQTDGNLVIYSSRDTSATNAIDSTGTNQAKSMYMQPDGNLVLYTSDNTPLWASNSQGSNSPYFLFMSADGTLYITDKDNKTVTDITLKGHSPIDTITGEYDNGKCYITINQKCRAYPSMNHVGRFDDSTAGGPKDTSDSICKTRVESWKKGCN